MCGRYALYYDSDKLIEQFGECNLEAALVQKDSMSKSHRHSYNIGPTQDGAVYRANNGSRNNSGVVSYMKWGLVPVWVKDISDFKPYSTFNARVENLLESKLWKSCIKKQRCVVAISGYYEWRGTGKNKVPFFVTRRDGRLMFLAGMYEHYAKGNFSTYTIVTSGAPKELRWLHERMPVVLEPGSREWNQWFSSEKTEWTQAELETILESCFDDHNLICYQVGKEVGKISSQGEQLTKPIFKKDRNLLDPAIAAKLEPGLSLKRELDDSSTSSELSSTLKQESVKSEPKSVSITDVLRTPKSSKRQKH